MVIEHERYRLLLFRVAEMIDAVVGQLLRAIFTNQIEGTRVNNPRTAVDRVLNLSQPAARI